MIERRISGLYMLLFRCGRIYIGSAGDVRTRTRHHLAALKAGRHTNRRMQGACRKYGLPTAHLVARCEPWQLLAFEQRAIDAFRPRYNIVQEINRPVMSRATCRRIAEALKGHPVSAETRAKISAAKKGVPMSAETCAKMADGQRRRAPRSAAFKAKCAEGMRGKQNSLGYRHTPEVKALLSDLRNLRPDAKRQRIWGDEHGLSA